ncbi:hypothetical protein Tco_0662947 [Tanacetum coccineum]
MLVEKKYPLRKEVLMQMLKLKLESEEENTMALELIKFVKKILAELESEEHKNWLVHDQTVHALASPKANELAIPEQTATGKGTSNPLMAGCKDLFLRDSQPSVDSSDRAADIGKEDHFMKG